VSVLACNVLQKAAEWRLKNKFQSYCIQLWNDVDPRVMITNAVPILYHRRKGTVGKISGRRRNWCDS
jgi:hypothetical protein